MIGKKKSKRLRKMLLYIEYVTLCLKIELGLEKPMESEDRMLKWFAFTHLPEKLQAVSKPFFDLAFNICATIESGPERTVALRKLLEAKDAAVRAVVSPGG